MSKTVDQRVVEMQFDNRHFERNVSTTMSTLEKLKRSLQLPDASKSLDGINRAASNVNLSGLSGAVDTVQSKFSALQVMGVTALANITNSAVNAGKRLIESFTVEPKKAGFQEYELKMGSIQTIMASTGESLSTVNRYLEELNKYSDQTIYSFQDMTSNIGKFTNAGVKLEDAVAAIKGVSNEAAISGANANEASRAMYNFAQALSAGYVKLIDWKSIENANMATVEFKNQLLETAVGLGTVKKSADGMYSTLKGNAFNATKNFNEVLQDQWMTSEVLIETLKKYASSETDIGKKAAAAATEVKTFSMMMDTLKESVQSGWAQTWEIIVGDFEEAKELFTNISNTVGGFLDNMSDSRNKKLKAVLTSPWEKLTEKLSEAGIEMSKYEEAIRQAAEAEGMSADEIDKLIEKHGSFAKAVKAGAFSSNILKKALGMLGIGVEKVDSEWAKLIESLKKVERLMGWGAIGEDVKTLQTALEKLGYSVGKCGLDGIIGPDTTAAIKEFQKEANIAVDGIAGPETIAALEKAGLKFNAITGEIEVVDNSYAELIDNITQKGGRELLLESFANILKAIVKPLKAIKNAWNSTFGGADGAAALFSVIEGFHALTEKLIISDDAAGKLEETFGGIFAGLKMFLGMFSGVPAIAVDVAKAVGGVFVELGGILGEYATRLSDWADRNQVFVKVYDGLTRIVTAFGTGIKKVYDTFMALPQVKRAIESVKESLARLFGVVNVDFDGTSIDRFCKSIEQAFSSVNEWLKGLENSENLGRDIVDGILIGLREGINRVVSIVSTFGQTVIETFCSVLGIASPSKVFIALGGFIVAGLLVGLKSAFPDVWGALSGFGKQCAEFLGNINFGQIIAAGLSVGMLVVVKKVLDITKMFGHAAQGFGDMMSGAGNVLNAFADRIKPAQKSKLENIIELLKALAIVFAVLTASAYVLGKMETDELIKAGIALGVMTGIVVGLTVLCTKIKGLDGKGVDFKPLMIIVSSLLIMAFALKQLAKIHLDDIPAVLASMVIMIGGVALLLLAFGKLVKGDSSKYMDKAGKMMIKMSIALMLMVGVFKLVSMVTDAEIYRGIAVVGAVELLFAAMVLVAKGSGKEATKVGGMLLKMSVAILIMLGVVKMASKLDGETVLKGTGVIVLIGALFAAMIAVTKSSGQNAGKLGVMLLLLSGALAIMVMVVKQAGKLSLDQIKNGLAVVAVLELLMAGLIHATKSAGGSAVKIAITLLAVSGALVILSGVLFILSKIDPQGLGRALAAVTVLELLMMGIIGISKNSKNCLSTLIGISIAIAVLTAAITALSFISPEKLEAATTAISSVMAMLALLIGVTKFASGGKELTSTLLIMTGVIAVLAGIVVGLSFIDTENALANCAALSMLLIAFSVSAQLLGKSGVTFKAAVGAIAPMMLVVVGLAAVLAVLGVIPMEGVMEKAIALTILLTAFSAALLLMNFVGPNAVAAIPAMAAMGLVVAELAIILGIMGVLDISVGIETATGMSILLLGMSAACAIVSLIPAAAALQGAIGLAAFVAVMTVVLTALGGLAQIPGFKDLIADGGGILASIGYALGNFVGSIVGGFSAGAMSGLPEIGTHLSEFMTNVTPFIDGVKRIDDTMLSGVKALAEAILIFTAVDMIQGITSFFGLGESSLESFGEELAGLGKNMNKFIKDLGTFTPEQVTSVTCAADALKKIAEAAKAIPNEGGWAGTILGENGIGGFVSQLPEVGSNLCNFATILTGFDENKRDAVGYAGEALVSIAEAASEIPNEGGWAASILGDNGIGAFVDKLPSVGYYLNRFVENLGKFGKKQVDYCGNAGKALAAIAESAKDIPNDGGWLGAIFGENGIGEFASKLPKLGTDLATFVNNLADAKMENITSASDVIAAIVELVNVDFTSATAGIAEFCEKMKTLATDAVEKFASGLTSRVSKNKAKDAVTEIVNAAAEKVESKSCYNAFHDAGEYLVDGLAKGIKDNKSSATSAAKEVATAVEEIIREAWQVNSPSKVFYGIALGIGEGVTDALWDSESDMVNSSGRFANSVTRGFSAALARVDDIIHNDIDMQPTIRPVLDLSEVKSGTGTLNGLLGSSSVGVSANIGAISTMMSSRGQNGVNSDVVSAINKLRGDLGKVGNTYNSINGITYDDGSSVSEAVKVLVRAARVERRV